MSYSCDFQSCRNEWTIKGQDNVPFTESEPLELLCYLAIDEFGFTPVKDTVADVRVATEANPGVLEPATLKCVAILKFDKITDSEILRRFVVGILEDEFALDGEGEDGLSQV